MAAISPTYLAGYGGSFEVDNSAQPIHSWQATHSVGTADCTNATSSGAREVIRTIESLDGSAVIQWKASGVPAYLVGSIYAVELITAGTQKWACNALIVSNAPSCDIRGNVTMTVTFQSTGAITVPA